VLPTASHVLEIDRRAGPPRPWRRGEAGLAHVAAARDHLVVLVADLDEGDVLAAVHARLLVDPLVEPLRIHDEGEVLDVVLQLLVGFFAQAVLEAAQHVEDLQCDQGHDHADHGQRDAQPDAAVHGVAASM